MISPGPEMSAKYVLTSPKGNRAVFNDPTDPDYIGVLTDISGFDSPEIREESENIPRGDGAVQGDFYFGRRPVTLTSKILNPSSITDRSDRAGKLRRVAHECMRGEGTLEWTVAAGATMFLNVKLQQRVAITGGWQKDALLAMVAGDPYIYSSSLKGVPLSGSAPVGFGFSFPFIFPLSFGGGYVVGQANAVNEGNAESSPYLKLTGPLTNPTLLNFTTGEAIKLTTTLLDGETIDIDVKNKTVIKNGSLNIYSQVDALLTQWWTLEPGNNDIRVKYDTSGIATTLDVRWRDAWL